MGETHYIKLATHNPLGPVSSAACLHLNLASSNLGVMEQPQRPGTGDDQRRPPAGGVGGRLPPAPHRPRPGDRVRPRGRRAPIPSRWPSCRSCADPTARSRTGEGSDPGGGGQAPGVTSSDHHSRVPVSRRRTSATRSTQGPGTGCPTSAPRAEGGLVSYDMERSSWPPPTWPCSSTRARWGNRLHPQVADVGVCDLQAHPQVAHRALPVQGEDAAHPGRVVVRNTQPGTCFGPDHLVRNGPQWPGPEGDLPPGAPSPGEDQAGPAAVPPAPRGLVLSERATPATGP